MLRDRLSILTYHRVHSGPDPMFPGATTARDFARHAAILRRFFNVLPLAEAAARLQERSLPAFAVCITFDDGYRDNLTVALPVLRRYELPATVFVASGFTDGGLMWNDIVIEALRSTAREDVSCDELGIGRMPLASADARRAAVEGILGKLKYRPPEERGAIAHSLAARLRAVLPRDLMLNRAELIALHKAGVTIGAHTVTHPILARLDPAAADREIRSSREALVALIDSDVTLFAYPNGKPNVDYRQEHVRQVMTAGFTAAVSTVAATARDSSDRFQLPRYGTWDRSRARFALRTALNHVRT
jgi:peptidoglycan/xylan/chitin deacetylase (PgdA/CDA1 family)